MSSLERIFETALWSVRWVVLLAVLGSLAASLAMFFLATVDTILTVSHLWGYADPRLVTSAREALRTTTVQHVVAIVDAYLLGAVLLIFAFGLYELFISKIEPAGEDTRSSNVLIIRSLDDLKGRLAGVILLILVVAFFERVLSMKLERPIDLFWMSSGIALVGLALWLGHLARGGGADGAGGH